MSDFVTEQQYKKLLATATKITKNKAEAQDAVQNALVKGYRQQAKHRGESSFYTWLHLLTVTAAFDVKRGQRGGHVSEEEAYELAAEDADYDAPRGPQSRGAAALVSQVNRVLNSVGTPKQALMLQARGLSQKQIASRLGIEEDATESRLRTGKARLTEGLCARSVIVGAKCLKAKLK